MRYYADFERAIQASRKALDQFGEDVDPGRWQGVPTDGKPDLVTREILDWGISVAVPDNIDSLQKSIQPSLPWADLEFEDRVGRVPQNPHKSLEHWPWWQGQEGATMFGGKFSHTYAERFWPREAGREERVEQKLWPKMRGIRYRYGDLDDLITMLLNDPQTRQAYLPIFFPEDTGAVHGGRIPCTLGYQFMLRDNKLHMWYFIRSCDYIRHFRDDIYLACRLLLWVLDELSGRWMRTDVNHKVNWETVDPGYLHMTCCSLHYHKGDEHLLNLMEKRYVGT